MKKRIAVSVLVLFLAGSGTWTMCRPVEAAEYKLPAGVSIELTKEFYQALQEGAAAENMPAGTSLSTGNQAGQKTVSGTTLSTSGVRAGNDSSSGTRLSTGTGSSEYLRQIAVSSRFMVESNLKILEQQEKMVKLLQEIARK